MDVFEELRVVFDELRVLVNVFLAARSEFVEVVHVQLSDETCEIAVLEIQWEHFFTEFICVVYHELGTVFAP